MVDSIIPICVSIIVGLASIGVTYVKFARDDRFKQIRAERDSDSNLISRLREDVKRLTESERDCIEEHSEHMTTVLELLTENRDLHKRLVGLLERNRHHP